VVPVLLVLLSACTAVPQGGEVRKVAAAKNAVVVPDAVHQVANGPAPNDSPAGVVEGLLVAMQFADTDVISEYLTDTYAPKWVSTSATRTAVFTKSTQPKQDNGGTATQTPVSLDLTLSGVIDSHGSWTQRSKETATLAFDLVNTPSTGGQWRVDNINQPGLFVSLDGLSQAFQPVHLYYPSQERSSSTQVPRLVPDTVYLPSKYSEGLLVRQLVSGPSSWLASGVSNPVAGASFNSVTPADANGLVTFNFSGMRRLKTGPVQALKTFEAQLAYTLAGSLFAGQASSYQIESDGVLIDKPFPADQLGADYNPDVLNAASPLYYVDADHHLVERDTSAASTASATPGADVPVVRLEHLDNVSHIAVSPILDVVGTATQLAAGVSPDKDKLELATLNDPLDNPWHEIDIPDAKSLSAPTFEVSGNSVWVVATMNSGESRLYAVPLTGTAAGTPVQVPVTTDAGVPALRGLTSARLSRDGSRIALLSSDGTRNPQPSSRQAYVGVVTQLASGGWQVNRARPVLSAISHVSQIDVTWQDRFTLGVATQKRLAPGGTNLLTVQADGTPSTTADGATADPVTVDGTPDNALQYAGAPSKPWVAASNGRLSQQPPPSDIAGPSVAQVWDFLDNGSAPTYAG
jgi:hypothetical protein